MAHSKYVPTGNKFLLHVFIAPLTQALQQFRQRPFGDKNTHVSIRVTSNKMYIENL